MRNHPYCYRHLYGVSYGIAAVHIACSTFHASHLTRKQPGDRPLPSERMERNHYTCGSVNSIGYKLQKIPIKYYVSLMYIINRSGPKILKISILAVSNSCSKCSCSFLHITSSYKCIELVLQRQLDIPAIGALMASSVNTQHVYYKHSGLTESFVVCYLTTITFLKKER